MALQYALFLILPLFFPAPAGLCLHTISNHTTDQRKIIDFIRSKGTATKAEIVALDGGQYYCNADKYIGDRLSRMVNAGMLERVKPVVFRIGSGKKPGNEPVNENQTTLF